MSAPSALFGPDFEPTPDARRQEVLAYRRTVRLIGRPVAQPAPGVGPPALLVPGFISGAVSLSMLARALRRAGLRTFNGGVGANLGCTDDMVSRLVDRAERIAAAEGTRVALVGHSRGGMIVKLAAQRRPDLVSDIVVLSAPVVGTLRVAPHVRQQLEVLYRLHRRGLASVISEDCVTGGCGAQIAAELDGPFPDDVAYTSIWSGNDAIIEPSACRDPAAELIEVASSHTGMGTDPTVHRLVIRRLAVRAAA